MRVGPLEKACLLGLTKFMESLRESPEAVLARVWLLDVGEGEDWVREMSRSLRAVMSSVAVSGVRTRSCSSFGRL